MRFGTLGSFEIGQRDPLTSQTQSSTRFGSAWLLNFGLTLPFLVLFWVNLAHHQFWSDELIAWGIANASGSVSRLFYFTHIEAHPWLWYFILWIASRVTHDPAALKWVEAVFGTAIYLVLGLMSPFGRGEKLLIFLSYYICFEYTVLSRMYSVMLLTALLYAWRRVRKPEGDVGNLALLGVMASTDASGILLSFALGLEYAYSTWKRQRSAGWSAESKRRQGWAGLVYAALLGFSVWSSRPVAATSYEVTGKMGAEVFKARRLAEAISDISAGPWWPISQYFPHHFWLTNNGWQPRLLVATLLAYWKIFGRERNLLLLMGAALGLEMIFADVVYRGRPRHWGLVFVAFLLALWMQRAKRSGEGERPGWSGWTYGLMGVSALAGCLAVGSSWLRPFSQARATANWIRANDPADVPLVGDSDFNLTSVVQQIPRPVYFLECACVDRFKLFDKSRDSFDPKEVPDRLNLAMKNLKTTELLLVNSKRLTGPDLAAYERASLEAEPVASFDGADVEWQNYYLYRVTRR
jgi:hypothetical protein